jgi:hypothetical protein
VTVQESRAGQEPAETSSLRPRVPADPGGCAIKRHNLSRAPGVRRRLLGAERGGNADTDGNGWDDTITYTVSFRVTNIDTRKVSGSCVVRSVVDGIGGPDVTRHSQTYSFTVAPGQQSADQSFVVGPVSVGEDQDVYSDEWVASCTSQGIRLR